MNALDKAFIKAYAKGVQGHTSAPACEPMEENLERSAAASQNRAAVEQSRLSPLVEVSAADGVWYRIEPVTAATEPATQHVASATQRSQRLMAERVQAAQSNLSAVEMLDSLLGLDEPCLRTQRPSGDQEQPRATYVRMDASESPANPGVSPSTRAVSTRAALLTQHELQAFVEGAEASVVTQRWDSGSVADVSPESLCQCWLAIERVAAPVVIEQSWAEILPPAAPTAAIKQQPNTAAPVIEDSSPMAASIPATHNAVTVHAASPAENTESAPSASKVNCEAPAPSQPTESPIAAAPAAPVQDAPPAPTVEVAKSPAKATEARSAPSLRTVVEAPTTIETPKLYTPPATAAEAEREDSPPLTAFQAAWEVDRLNWPEECDRLARGDTFGPLAKMLIETSRGGKSVIAVTGARRGEGRSTLALCLARRAAKEGANVAVLDADFERPHLGRRIGIDMENGWDDVLTDGQPLAEAAVSSLEDRVTVFPLGRRAAAFVSAHTVTALQQLAQAFDLVLVDMGPVGEDEAADATVECQSAAAALVVCDRRHATEADLGTTLDRLHAAGIETLGVVETFA